MLARRRISSTLDGIIVSLVKKQQCPACRAHTQAFFHSLFLEANHNGSVIDCNVVIIDETNPAERTIRQMYWINKLETMHPLGLKIENEPKMYE